MGAEARVSWGGDETRAWRGDHGRRLSPKSPRKERGTGPGLGCVFLARHGCAEGEQEQAF